MGPPLRWKYAVHNRTCSFPETETHFDHRLPLSVGNRAGFCCTEGIGAGDQTHAGTCHHHGASAEQQEDSCSEASTTGHSETHLSSNQGGSDSRTMSLLARGMQKVMRPVTRRYGTERASRSDDGGGGGASASVSQVTTPRWHLGMILYYTEASRVFHFKGKYLR